MIREIERLLYDNSICANVWENKTLGTIQVEIEWGDWKHDHARAEWLIQENGYKHIGTDVTEEDGSDCYSAIHYFIERS